MKRDIISKKENKRERRKETIIDIIIISFGLFISSFGIALFYAAGMGSGAMATFCDGLHNIFGFTYGGANICANVLFLLILIGCDRKLVNIGTVLCVFTIGIYVDLGTAFFGRMAISGYPVLIRGLCVLTGTVMMGGGLGLYVAVGRGYGALEGLVKFFCGKTGCSFGTAKIMQDIILIVLGILMHAAWGIGTLFSAVLTGPVMQVSIRYFEKYLYNIRNREWRKTI